MATVAEELGLTPPERFRAQAFMQFRLRGETAEQGVKKMHSTVRSWLSKTREELDEIYRNAEAGRMPQGDTHGTAILAGSVAGFGIARWVTTMAENWKFPYPLRAFKDRESAMEWLLQDATGEGSSSGTGVA